MMLFFATSAKKLARNFSNSLVNRAMVFSKKTSNFLLNNPQRPTQLNLGFPTILQHAQQPWALLQELFLAYGTENYEDTYRSLAQLVLLNPERMILHEIITTLICTAKIEDETELIQKTLNIHAKVSPFLKKILNQRVIKERSAVSLRTSQELINNYHLHGSEAEQAWEKVHPIWDPIFKRMKMQYKILDNEQLKQINKIVIQVVADDLTREYLEAVIKQYVTAFFNELFLFQKLIPLSMQYESPLTVMAVGGPGSGKSTLISRISQYYKNYYQLSKSQISVLTADRLRAILTKVSDSLGEDIKYYGCLTQDEVIYVYDKILNRMKDLRTRNKMLPAFFESTFIYDNHVKTALCNNGKLELYLTFTDVSQALIRNQQRFAEKNERYVPDDDVLKGAQTVAGKLPIFITKYLNTKIKIIICNTEKMKDAEQFYTPIAIFNLEENKMYLLNISGMLDFIKQSEINIDAKDNTQIYSDLNRINLQTLANKFKLYYSFCQIHFLHYIENSPLQSEHLERYTYAIFSDDNLIIRQPDIFAMIQQQEGAKQIFNILTNQNVNNFSEKTNTDSKILSM